MNTAFSRTIKYKFMFIFVINVSLFMVSYNKLSIYGKTCKYKIHKTN